MKSSKNKRAGLPPRAIFATFFQMRQKGARRRHLGDYCSFFADFCEYLRWRLKRLRGKALGYFCYFCYFCSIGRKNNIGGIRPWRWVSIRLSQRSHAPDAAPQGAMHGRGTRGASAGSGGGP
jgi:hypothetical protein